MSKFDIVRAWKDPEYRASLSAEQRSQLPENPAGIIDLSELEMDAVVGGADFKVAIGGDNTFAELTGCGSVCEVTIYVSRGGCCPDPKFAAR